MGALWTSLGMQTVGTVLYAAALLALGRWPAIATSVLPWGIGLGLLGNLSLYFLYRSLAIGPIAVVSPVVASYTAVTVILVVVFLGEQLSALQTLAIVVTFAGVLLASTDIRQVVATLGRPLPGVRIALIATIGFGCWGALMAGATRTEEPLALVLVGRASAMVALLVIVAALRRRPPSDRSARAIGLLVAVGVFDTIANVLFVVGVQGGFAAIVATASGIYPVLPAVLAIVVLGERLALNQYAGIAVILGGLALLGLSASPGS
ncbi:MAG: DMT family transporter [Chloroflexi bacterium]|nr:DMT family transporter [Chloroflexota bacterium]